MMLYLMRHGHAVPGHAMTDSARYLDARGRKEARAVGRKLRDKAVVVDVIVCSPLVRAVQTAELVAVELGYQAEIVAIAALEPDAAPAGAVRALEALGARILAVSHEPLVSELSAHLGAGGAGYQTGQVTLITGGQRLWSLAA